MDLEGSHIGIVAQRGNERAHGLARELIDLLEAWGAMVTIDAATGEVLDHRAAAVAAMADVDLLVTLGGDGTLLFAAREAVTPPVFGVDLGEVGFLSTCQSDDAIPVLEDTLQTYMQTGSVPTTARSRLEAHGADWSMGPVANDVAVLGPHRGRGGGATMSIHVDGESVTAGHADGVLVATPTGSTAYALSEGGPIVEQTVSALLVMGMSPAWDRPPLVVDADRTVTIEVADAPTATAIGDGRMRDHLEPPTTVTVERAGEPLRIVPGERTLYEGLADLE